MLTDVTRGRIVAGTAISLFDDFNTRNDFHGGQFGIASEWRRGRWTVDSNFKLALGNTHSRVGIQGGTMLTRPGHTTRFFDSGVFTLPTNLGMHETNQFSVVPEIGLTLGYDVTQRLRATFGYTFIYWSNVLRPGDQVNTDLSPSQSRRR